MNGLQTPSKFDLRHTESRVVFDICDCSLNKQYSFYKLSKEQAKKFIDRLCYIKKMNWKKFASLPRETGITVEKPNSESFNMIDTQNTSERKLVEKFYFHFRVGKTSTFRIFGYQLNEFFCLTHIDYNGKFHHP